MVQGSNEALGLAPKPSAWTMTPPMPGMENSAIKQKVDAEIDKLFAKILKGQYPDWTPPLVLPEPMLEKDLGNVEMTAGRLLPPPHVHEFKDICARTQNDVEDGIHRQECGCGVRRAAHTWQAYWSAPGYNCKLVI
jgi:hypothetical protein